MTFQVDDLLSGIFRPYKSNSRQVLFNYTLPKINLNSMQERTVGTGCNRSWLQPVFVGLEYLEMSMDP